MKSIVTNTYTQTREVRTKYGINNVLYNYSTNTQPYTPYIVGAGDNAYTIAQKAYKDQVSNPMIYYHVICKVNKIIDPFDLTHLIGREIKIPTI